VTEVGLGAGQVPRRFERHVSPGRQVELGTGSVDGTIGGELHGHKFSSVRLEQRPYGNPVLEAGPGAIFDPTLRTPESKLHVTVRARQPCRLAVRRRDSAGERESSRRRRTTNGAAGRTSAPNLEDAERATALPPGICPPSPDYARTSSTGTRA